jgi:putative amide transporter protein
VASADPITPQAYRPRAARATLRRGVTRGEAWLTGMRAFRYGARRRMASIGLFFIGSVLFVNGLALLGRVSADAAAPINALIGLLLVAVVAAIAIPARDMSSTANRNAMLSAAGFLVFALTYLWVAVNNWTGRPNHGLGWYCCWAVGVSVFFGLVAFLRVHDPKEGTLWVLWAVLFAVFWALLGLDRVRLRRAAGWLAITEAFVTASIPGGLLLLGDWGRVATGWVVGAAVVTLTGFVVLAAHDGRAEPAKPQ